MKNCQWKNSKVFGPCKGPVTLKSKTQSFNHECFACDHHAKAMAHASALGLYKWKKIS
jgi:hypothetical protein